MNDVAPVTTEEFAAMLRRLDMALAPDEAERLREAVAALRALLARLADEPEFLHEPAILFAPSGSRLAT
jgi:ubiquinone biosynthesis protein UbiJ